MFCFEATYNSCGIASELDSCWYHAWWQWRTGLGAGLCKGCGAAVKCMLVGLLTFHAQSMQGTSDVRVVHLM